MTEPAYVLTSSSGQAQPTDLSVAISGATDTSFTVAAAGTWLESHGANAGSAMGTTGPFKVVVDAGLSSEEHIYCSSVNTSTGLVQVYNSGGFLGRGYDGTTAVAHSTSTGTGYVYPIIGSQDQQEANRAAVAIGKATTAGDTLYATAAQTFARLGIGAVGTVNTSTGSAPSWAYPAIQNPGNTTAANGFTAINSTAYVAFLTSGSYTGSVNYLLIATGLLVNSTGGSRTVTLQLESGGVEICNHAFTVVSNGLTDYSAPVSIMGVFQSTRAASQTFILRAKSDVNTANTELGNPCLSVVGLG